MDGETEAAAVRARGRRSSLVVVAVAAPALVLLAAATAAALLASTSSSTESGPTVGAWAVAALSLTALTCAAVAAWLAASRARAAGEAGAAGATAADDVVPANDPAQSADGPEPARPAEVRVRRQVLASLIEALPDPAIVAEDDGNESLRIRTVNRHAAELAGLPAVEMIGRPLGQVIQDASGAWGVVQRILDEGRVAGRDARFATTTGEPRDVRVSAEPLDPVAGDGAPRSWLVVASSNGQMRREERRRVATSRISELAQAAETSLELFRGVESVLRGAMHVDAFHLAGVERAAGKLTVAYCSDPRTPGVTVHEVSKGLSGYALDREAAIILNAEQIRLLVQRGEVKAAEPVAEHWASAPMRLGPGDRGLLVIQNRDPRRSYQSADVDLLSFAAGQVAGWFRRRRAEVERERLSAAVEQAVDAVMLLDANGRVEYVNPAFERQTGFTREESVGRPLSEIWISAEREAPVAAIWECVRAGRPWTGSVSCVRKSGDPFPVQGTLSAVIAADGRVTEHIVVQHDVSHETELEEQLRQAQKMEAVGILAGGVAHDFNNLLSVIQGYGEFIRQTVTDPDATTWIEQVLAASRRASNLVGQLLAFSRRQVISPQPLDLRAVVRDVEKLIDPLIGEDIALVIEEAGELDLVEADPHKVEQVLMNLAVNARDAMPRGGKLVVRTSMEEIDAERAATLPGLEAGTHVVLTVTDDGVGMPPEVRRRVFEPFFTTKPKGHGTGLGLSTVYGIVKQAGGHIALSSEERRGTEFRIYLPSIGRCAAPAPEQDPGDTMRRGTETVLVVEDESALRLFVERVLTRQGYRVIAAPDGSRGAEVARAFEEPIDLLLADVVMPGMNGPALAATLKEERHDLAVLYMSGYPDASIASYGVLDADVDLLQKPFTSPQLLKRVRRALDLQRKRNERPRRRLAPIP